MYEMRKDVKQKIGLDDLVDYVNLPADAEVAEVGVYRGESCRIWAENYRTVWAIDPWWENVTWAPKLSNAAQLNKAISLGIENLSDLFTVDIEKDFDTMCKSYPNINKIKATSATAASLFDNHSLDMVYIDGDHSYLSVMEDLSLWINKIKESGWIAGHDYSSEFHPNVIKAVNDYLGEPDEVFIDSSWVIKL